MNQERTVFSQIMDFFPRYEFDKCVQRYNGNYKVRKLSCYQQYLCMAFAQLTSRSSLRDIVICLDAMGSKLYHVGFRNKIARNTLAIANKKRDWCIYADFAHVLIPEARKLYLDDAFGVELDHSTYAFDSTTIDLCLSLFPWARFRKRKGAVKLHTLLDLRGSIPCFIYISTGKMHDVNAIDHLTLEPGSFYVMDRAFIDYQRLYRFTQQMAFFVVRAKKNLDYSRKQSRPVDKSTGLRSDQTILLKGYKSSREYPVAIRRISFQDTDKNRRFVYLSNNFDLPPLTIAKLYKSRWQIEIFFKWIKQHLRIKSFYGTTDNAVRTQIWIAVSVYLMIAIMKKELHLERKLYEILQIISITLFEKVPIKQLLEKYDHSFKEQDEYKQLNLFNF